MRGGENNNNAWREDGKWCVDTERQKMKANTWDKRSIVFYNELKQVGKRILRRSLQI